VEGAADEVAEVVDVEALDRVACETDD